MNATQAIDLEDIDGLLAADRQGLLRSAVVGGRAGARHRRRGRRGRTGLTAQPATAPRSVIWVAGRGTAETAGDDAGRDAGWCGVGADRDRQRGAAVGRVRSTC